MSARTQRTLAASQRSTSCVSSLSYCSQQETHFAYSTDRKYCKFQAQCFLPQVWMWRALQHVTSSSQSTCSQYAIMQRCNNRICQTFRKRTRNLMKLTCAHYCLSMRCYDAYSYLVQSDLVSVDDHCQFSCVCASVMCMTCASLQVSYAW
jgi:hypothetical protein